MDRRKFLTTTGVGVLGLSLQGCALRSSPRLPPRRRPVHLAPVDASWERIIRTTVGLRPHRDSGFLLRPEKFDGKTVIHNYGHGGAGMSLSWGTGAIAAELALDHGERRAAVLGCGIIGLTAARQLQRRGFDVVIYAAALPPDTTSNMSWASFTPTSGLVGPRGRTPEWDALFRRAVEMAYREHQLLVGPRYGVSWVDEYSTSNSEGVVARARAEAVARAAARADAPGQAGRAGVRVDSAARAAISAESDELLPPDVELGRELLLEGEHPFGSRYARRFPTLRFEPSIYLDALMRDVIAFGGRIVVRQFDTIRDIMMLEENLIINCTGLGAKSLFNDEQLVPVKGQLVVLVPQPEVTYATANMLPRSDGIILGHVMLRGDSSYEVNEVERARVVEAAIRFFSAMRMPAAGVDGAATALRDVSEPSGYVPALIPPVQSFFGRES